MQESGIVLFLFCCYLCLFTRFFYKIHFYKQRQAEIGKKMKQMLSNTLRLNFCYLKIIRLFHSKITGDILKNLQITSMSVKRRFYDYDNEKDAENEK